jgi:hypothetical protein
MPHGSCGAWQGGAKMWTDARATRAGHPVDERHQLSLPAPTHWGRYFEPYSRQGCLCELFVRSVGLIPRPMRRTEEAAGAQQGANNASTFRTVQRQ